MENLLKQKVDLMAENYYDIQRTFNWNSDIIKYFTALNLANKNIKIDTAKFKEIKDHIKKEVGIFSQFKGINLFDLTSLLQLEDDYLTFFNNMKVVYEKLIQEGFKESTYLPLASYTIVKQSKAGKWDENIQRMNDFYALMKKNHFWLTSKDDYIFSAMLATSDLKVKNACDEMEECYNYLHQNGFSKGNSLQTLSQILVLGEESITNKCDKVIALKEYLKREKCKISHHTIISLGALSFVTSNEAQMAKEIHEVYEYIRQKEKYGMLSIQKSYVIIIAISLVTEFYIEKLKSSVIDTRLANSLNAIAIVQEQTAVIISSVISTASITTNVNS